MVLSIPHLGDKYDSERVKTDFRRRFPVPKMHFVERKNYFCNNDLGNCKLKVETTKDTTKHYRHCFKLKVESEKLKISRGALKHEEKRSKV